MSSLESAFAIKAFRESLRSAVTLAQTDRDSIHKSLRADAKAPRGSDATTWLNLVGAVRLAYMAALKEGHAEVGSDIRTALAGEFSDAEVDQFLVLLVQDDKVDARNAAVLGHSNAKPKLGISQEDSNQATWQSGVTDPSVIVLRNR